MKLHLTIRLRAPPHLTGAMQQIRPIEGDIDHIKQAFAMALQGADLAGIFEGGGCLDVVVQGARIESSGS